MIKKRKFPIFRWAGIILILLTVTLITIQLVSYSRIRNNFPEGMTIADIPIGGLNYEEASERIYTVYHALIELRYDDYPIQVRPTVLGFEPKVERMLAVADNLRISDPFWDGFWGFLWGQSISNLNIPLDADYDETRIEEYLRLEIASRYDTPATPPQPVPGSTQFASGSPGTQLDIDRAVLQIVDALESPNKRVVNLALNQNSAPGPSISDLEVMLKQLIDVSGFDGIVELYMKDLSSNSSIHFAYQSEGNELKPNIAFSSWSTVKIPVMISAFREMKEPYQPEYLDLMEEMIEQSDNSSTDELAMKVLDQNLSPLIVSEDMERLGLENTFWAGHFYFGAPLLQNFQTPANQREDISTDPDIYNQTTPAEMGMLMEDIYQCAELNGGALIAAFSEEITQQECEVMIDILAKNQIAVLIQAGVPSGTTVAHKHGWANESDGLIHTIGDTAIVYTPGGNYVLTIFVHHPVQAVFDPVNALFADLSAAVYNFYNN